LKWHLAGCAATHGYAATCECDEVRSTTERAAAARALRELADDADNNRLPVLDGGSSYIDIRRRADEIESSYTSDADIYRKSP
jgi:hypothetical protein